jgi:O-antigen/teichoic acid export membrane protein
MGGRAAGRGLEFLTQVVLARVLGPSAFGVYALGRVIVRALGVGALLGLNNGVVRYGATDVGARPERVRRVVEKALLLGACSGLVIALGLFASAGFWAGSIFGMADLEGALRAMSWSLPLMSLLAIGAAATRLTLRMGYSVLAEDLLQPAANIVLASLFFLLGGRLLGASVAFSLSFACAALAALVLARRLLAPAARGEVGGVVSSAELLGFSVPTAIAGTLGVYVLWVDRLLLGYFRTPAEVGVYQSVSQLAAILTVLLSAFNAIIGPLAARLHVEGRTRDLEEVFQAGTKWGLYCGLPVYLTMLLGGRDLVVSLFGPAYASGVSVLVILATGQLVNLATGAVGITLIMTGSHHRWMVVTASSLGVNFLLGLLLVPRYGPLGAALSTAISVCSMNLVGVAMARSRPGVWGYNRRYWKGVSAALLAAAATWAAVELAGPAGWMHVLVVIVTCCTVFAAALRVFGFDDEDRELLRVLRERARGASPRGPA